MFVLYGAVSILIPHRFSKVANHTRPELDLMEGGVRGEGGRIQTEWGKKREVTRGLPKGEGKTTVARKLLQVHAAGADDLRSFLLFVYP